MLLFLTAGVAESVDAPDSKSGEGNLVWVRVPPPALKEIPAKGIIFHTYAEASDTLVGGRGSSRAAVH